MRLTSGAVLKGPEGVIATRVYVADTHRSRLRGVLGRPPLEPDEALVITDCTQVHTFGVRYALDVVFCDLHDMVLHVETLQPGRMSKRVGTAWACVELLGGRASECRIVVGSRVFVEEPI
jgi:uncharacterized protein